MPLALAVMIVVPAATPVARPVGSMLATLELLLVHWKLVATTLLLMSYAVAVNCCVPPTAIVALVGEMVMLLTTGVTVRAAVLLGMFPALEVAMIWVVPGDTPVATPDALMLAMLVALLVQVKVAPVMTLPPVSLATAVKACWPRMLTELISGVTVTLAGVVVPDPPQPGKISANKKAIRDAARGQRNERMIIGVPTLDFDPL